MVSPMAGEVPSPPAPRTAAQTVAFSATFRLRWQTVTITAFPGGSRRRYQGDTPCPPGRSPADEILHVLLGTEEGRQDPYLLYRALRDIAPLFRSQLDGHWYASRYDDCKAILVDPRAGLGPGMVTRYGQNPALHQRFARRM